MYHDYVGFTSELNRSFFASCSSYFTNNHDTEQILEKKHAVLVRCWGDSGYYYDDIIF